MLVNQRVKGKIIEVMENVGKSYIGGFNGTIPVRR
jgi:hypothetical protein